MNKQLETKLKDLPTSPGIYFHKDKAGRILYIGKAANLRSRVRQYFQNSRVYDPKTDALVREIVDTDWTELETELDALFVEAEMIRRYMPAYNILLRDDKSFVFVRINIKADHPTVVTTRHPQDDGAEYFGPYPSKLGIARALKYLRRAFPYSTHTTNVSKRACLQAQLGLCPGLEARMTSLEDYRKNLRLLMAYLRGGRKKLIRDIERDMAQASKNQQFEIAGILRNKLFALKNLEKQIIFSDRENLNISKDNGLRQLGELLSIDPPRRIEGFDISHMSGVDNAASMVVFASGIPARSQYRKFKLRLPGNDDFAHMQEVMTRRFSVSNIKKWGKPDLILIDGGKGQVSAALTILNMLSIKIPLIGLAKRYEEIIIPLVIENEKVLQFKTLKLPDNSDALKLLQRVRDESHRFAISYHSTLKRTRQTVNPLESIPGIGPETRKRLQRAFGSSKAIMSVSEDDLASVVGRQKASLIVPHKAT